STKWIFFEKMRRCSGVTNWVQARPSQGKPGSGRARAKVRRWHNPHNRYQAHHRLQVKLGKRRRSGMVHAKMPIREARGTRIGMEPPPVSLIMPFRGKRKERIGMDTARLPGAGERRLESVDALRGLAALAVVTTHIPHFNLTPGHWNGLLFLPAHYGI